MKCKPGITLTLAEGQGIWRKIQKIQHLPPNRLNQNVNGTILKLVSRASQWVPMLRGFDKLIEFSSFLFSHYGDQRRPPSLTLSVLINCRMTTLLPISIHSALNISGPIDSKPSANERELNFRSRRSVFAWFSLKYRLTEGAKLCSAPSQLQI
jgi:hypothetical protein